nr:uncharacterized protein LOC119167633 [Rhipicephalus microplus]
MVVECIWPVHLSKTWNIAKFVNTSENIWTYDTNDRRYIECKVDIKKYATTTSLFFDRRFYLGHESVHIAFEGRFFAKMTDRMALRHAANHFEQMEIMLYYGKNGGCAIFRVKTSTGDGRPIYDLRVKDSYITQGPSARCVLKFLTYRIKAKTIYEKGCNVWHALNKRTRFLQRRRLYE